MKWILGVAAATVLVLIASPPVVGFMLESQLESGFRQSAYGELVEVELVDYERGLYSSAGKMRIAPTDAYVDSVMAQSFSGIEDADQAEAVRAQLEPVMNRLRKGLLLDVNVTHGLAGLHEGPFVGLGVVETTIDSSSPAVADLQEELNIPYLMRNITTVNVDGSGDYVADIPAFQWGELESSGSYTGARMSGDFGSGFSSVRIDADLGSMQIAGLVGDVSIDGIRLESDTQLVEDFLSTGTTELSVGSVTFESPLQGFVMTGFVLDSDLQLNDAGDRLSMSVGYSVESASDLQAMKLSNATLRMKAANIDRQALVNYVDVIIPSGATADRTSEEVAVQIAQAGFDIARASVDVSIDPIAFDLNDDHFETRMNVRIDGDRLPAMDELEARPDALLMALSGDARMQATENLVNFMARSFVSQQIMATVTPEQQITPEEIESIINAQTPILLAQLVSQGMIVKGEGSYSGELKFSNGMLNLNGNEIPLMPEAAAPRQTF